MDIRCFIAVDIPDAVKTEIGDVIGNLKKYDADIKWVSPDNIHITLKFLGSTPEKMIPGIKDALSLVIQTYKPFYIKIAGAGVFPGRRNPRVCWIGMECPEILRKLKQDMENSMQQFGFQKEERDFNPHLTIGRVRSPKGTMNILTELDNIKEREFGNIFVGSVKLMKSDLKPGGPVYSCLHEIKFERV